MQITKEPPKSDLTKRLCSDYDVEVVEKVFDPNDVVAKAIAEFGENTQVTNREGCVFVKCEDGPEFTVSDTSICAFVTDLESALDMMVVAGMVGGQVYVNPDDPKMRAMLYSAKEMYNATDGEGASNIFMGPNMDGSRYKVCDL